MSKLFVQKLNFEAFSTIYMNWYFSRNDRKWRFFDGEVRLSRRFEILGSTTVMQSKLTILFSQEGHSIIFTPEKEMPPIPAACLVYHHPCLTYTRHTNCFKFRFNNRLGSVKTYCDFVANPMVKWSRSNVLTKICFRICSR